MQEICFFFYSFYKMFTIFTPCILKCLTLFTPRLLLFCLFVFVCNKFVVVYNKIIVKLPSDSYIYDYVNLIKNLVQ